MARRKKEKTNQKEQFSKRLAGRTEWFWFFYMVLMAAVLAYQPNVGNVVIYLSGLVTIVMITSVLAYTSNSKYDKALYTMRVLGWKDAKPKTEDKSEDNTEEEGPEEEGENG